MRKLCLILSLALLTGCSSVKKFFADGYRVCFGNQAAQVCVDKPNGNTNQTILPKP